MQSFDHINHKLGTDKLNRISRYSREHMNSPALLAAIPLQHSVSSAPVDEPPSVFSQWTSAKTEPGQILYGMQQVQYRWQELGAVGTWEASARGSGVQLSAPAELRSQQSVQPSFDEHISFEKLIPAALLLVHFNLGRKSIIWHITLERLVVDVGYPSASTCPPVITSAWVTGETRNLFYPLLQDTQVDLGFPSSGHAFLFVFSFFLQVEPGLYYQRLPLSYFWIMFPFCVCPSQGHRDLLATAYKMYPSNKLLHIFLT